MNGSNGSPVAGGLEQDYSNFLPRPSLGSPRSSSGGFAEPQSELDADTLSSYLDRAAITAALLKLQRHQKDPLSRLQASLEPRTLNPHSRRRVHSEPNVGYLDPTTFCDLEAVEYLRPSSAPPMSCIPGDTAPPIIEEDSDWSEDETLADIRRYMAGIHPDPQKLPRFVDLPDGETLPTLFQQQTPVTPPSRDQTPESQKTQLLDLPPEILHRSLSFLLADNDIAQMDDGSHLPIPPEDASSFISVSLTCIRLHHLAYTWLYRSLELDSGSKILACSGVLIRNPTAAKAVRTIHINLDVNSYSQDSLFFYESNRAQIMWLFARALERMATNLVSLQIYCIGKDLFRGIELDNRIAFSSLSELVWDMPLPKADGNGMRTAFNLQYPVETRKFYSLKRMAGVTPALLVILNRSPSLERLIIEHKRWSDGDPRWLESPVPSSFDPEIRYSRLTVIACPAPLAIYLLPKSHRVRDLYLSWLPQYHQMHLATTNILHQTFREEQDAYEARFPSLVHEVCQSLDPHYSSDADSERGELGPVPINTVRRLHFKDPFRSITSYANPFAFDETAVVRQSPMSTISVGLRAMGGLLSDTLEELILTFSYMTVVLLEHAELVDVLNEILPKSKTLRTVVIAHRNRNAAVHAFHGNADQFAFEEGIVMQWGKICPTLRHCEFPSGTTWTRYHEFGAWTKKAAHFPFMMEDAYP